MATDQPTQPTPATESAGGADKPLNLAALIPEHFARYFAFFRPGHTEGVQFYPPHLYPSHSTVSAD